jgi:hypothetical protein
VPRHCRSTGRLCAGQHAGPGPERPRPRSTARRDRRLRQGGSAIARTRCVVALARRLRRKRPKGGQRSLRDVAAELAQRPPRRAGPAVLGGVVAIDAGLRTRGSNEAGHFRNSRKVGGEREQTPSGRCGRRWRASFAELAQERRTPKSPRLPHALRSRVGPVVVRRGGEIFGDVLNSWRLSETATRDTIDMPLFQVATCRAGNLPGPLFPTSSY